MKNSPSQDCCFPACPILDSNDTNYLASFTELAGSWTTGTSGGDAYWETNAAGAAIATTVGASAGRPWRVRGRFRFTPAGGSASWQLIGGASDASNYCYADVRILFSGGNYFLQLRLGQYTGGSPTEYSLTPYSSTTDQLSALATYDGFVNLSWDEEGSLNASVGLLSAGQDSRSWVLTQRNVTPPGGFAALFVTACTGTLRMSQFLFEHGYSPSGTTLCTRAVENCAKGVPPPTMTIKISNATKIANWIGGPHCACVGEYNYTGPFWEYDCVGFEGEFTANFTGDGDDLCTWETAQFVIDEEDCTDASGEDQCGPDIIYETPFELLCWLVLSVRYDLTDPTQTRRIISVQVWTEDYITSGIVAEFELATTTSITEMSSYTTITKLATPHDCHSPGLTCEIKT